MNKIRLIISVEISTNFPDNPIVYAILLIRSLIREIDLFVAFETEIVVPIGLLTKRNAIARTHQ